MTAAIQKIKELIDSTGLLEKSEDPCFIKCRLQSKSGLFRVNNEIQDIKLELIKIVLKINIDNLFLIYNETPDGVLNCDNFEKDSDGTLVLYKSNDPVSLFQWLNLGNWVLYTGKSKLNPMPQFSIQNNCSNIKLNAQIPLDLGIIILSDFDNDPWFIYLRKSILS